jgi:hypothetical protein
MFGKSTSHLGMSFQDLTLATLLLNNQNDFKIKKIWKY